MIWRKTDRSVFFKIFSKPHNFLENKTCIELGPQNSKSFLVNLPPRSAGFQVSHNGHRKKLTLYSMNISYNDIMIITKNM